MKLLSASQILGADDLKRELVEVPEWGGSIYVRGLTGSERDQWERSFLQNKNNKAELDLDRALGNARARLCSMTIVDDQGARLFTDAQAAELGNKSAQVLDRVYAVAQRLSGISKQDVDELTEALKQNPSAASPSVSVSPSVVEAHENSSSHSPAQS